jgi:hypothetical protein
MTSEIEPLADRRIVVNKQFMRSMMHSTLAVQSDATTGQLYRTSSLQSVDSCTVRTPQRTACYHDKNRIRLKEAKKWGLVASGCFSSKEVKYWLKKLSLRLSLRMTSAWVAIWKELGDRIKSAKQTYEISSRPTIPPELTQFKKGDRVIWAQRLRESTLPQSLLDNAPAYIHSCWNGWLAIWKITDGLAWLEGWAGNPIPLSDLHIVA